MEIIEQTKQNCLQLYLPNEIINTILEYQGYHIWRNGKFMRRLNINDQKYNNLKNLNIIKKIKDGSYMVTILIIRNSYVYKYIIEQTNTSTMIHWSMYKYLCHSIYPKQRTYNKLDEIKYLSGTYQNLQFLRMNYSYRR